jgi:hypothetical protein
VPLWHKETITIEVFRPSLPKSFDYHHRSFSTITIEQKKYCSRTKHELIEIQIYKNITKNQSNIRSKSRPNGKPQQAHQAPDPAFLESHQ